MSEPELQPCRHCETETRQRVEGIPYCSSDCIGARRREQQKETIRCPYPYCDWETRFLPDNNLSKAVAYRKADEHREYHARVNREVQKAVSWAERTTVERLCGSTYRHPQKQYS